MRKYSLAIVASTSSSPVDVKFIRKTVKKTLEQTQGLGDKKLSICQIRIQEIGYHVRIKNAVSRRLKRAKPKAVVFFDPNSETNVAWTARRFAETNPKSVVLYFGHRTGYDSTHLDGLDNLVQKNNFPIAPFCELVSAAIMATHNLV